MKNDFIDLNQLGIVVALESEASCLTGKKPVPGIKKETSPGISLLLSGIGSQRAADSAVRLINSNIGCIISFGTAAALSEDLKSGDLVIPETVYDSDLKGHQVHPVLHKKTIDKFSGCPGNLITRQLISVNKVVSSIEDKQRLHHESGAAVVDMESAAVLKVANENNIPCLVLRVILDTATMSIPGVVLDNSDIYGNLRMPAFLLSLLQNPTQIPQFVRLVSGYFCAARTLKWTGRQLPLLLDKSTAGSMK